ncbi:hypothetical protein R5R35_008731 [Gryllus longicercus]|uniref:lysozyme n=1 Tax=Gryllus longicercus TaxID=2509291 RepID=A0AAN9Z549_9ORTH
MLRVALLLALVCAGGAKIYQPCDLARELLYTYGLPRSQIATWVCIAFAESSYNTAAVGPPNSDGSRDHGLFQINDSYWCYPGKGCATSCSSFEDDNIADDVACVRKIYSQTAGYSGNGFTAWTTYSRCYSPDSYIAGCGI